MTKIVVISTDERSEGRRDPVAALFLDLSATRLRASVEMTIEGRLRASVEMTMEGALTRCGRDDNGRGAYALWSR